MSKRLNVGSWINVGHEQNVQTYVTKKPSNLKIFEGCGKKFQNKKAVGTGKNSKSNKHRAYVYSGL